MIPFEVVENYKSVTTFMVDKDNCYMEAVEARTVWIPKLSYEVFRHEWIAYTNILLKKPKDMIWSI